MANPRQRRKARSSITKNTKSKQSTKNEKKVVIRGPAAIVSAWDVNKTMRQNYAAMGLLSSMNPRQKGGVEPVQVTRASNVGSASREAEVVQPTLGPNGEIPQGYARLIRDTEGNVIDVIFADEEVGQPQASGSSRTTPWGQPLNATEEEWNGIAPLEDSGLDQLQGIPMPQSQHKGGDGVHIQNHIRPATAVVQELEKLASAPVVKVPRHSSELEVAWLQKLVAKHGDDLSAMVRDPKVNVWQKTKGEISRAIKKAGGIEALRA